MCSGNIQFADGNWDTAPSLSLSLLSSFNSAWQLNILMHCKHSLSLSYLPAGHPSWLTPPWAAPRHRLTWRKVHPAGRPPRPYSSPPTSPWRVAPSPPAETWSLCPSASIDLASRGKGREKERQRVRKTFCGDSEQTYPRLLSHQHSKGVSLTSHLLGFSLQLSLVIFRFTGNPFILIPIPVQPSKRKKTNITAYKLYTNLQTNISKATSHTISISKFAHNSDRACKLINQLVVIGWN